MASLSKHRNGWNIRYVDRDGVQRSFYPGKMPKKAAEGIKRHLEQLLASQTASTAVPGETASWIAGCGLAMRNKLHVHGLIAAPEEAAKPVSIGVFTADYIARRGDVKRNSKNLWRTCRNHIMKFFEKDRPISSVSVGDAKDFRQWMLREGRGAGRGLAENTVRKTCSFSAQVFADALDRGFVTSNPFIHRDIPKTTRENRTRDFFVTRGMAEAVLEACSDDEWRLIFGLSRFGGMRCPSEHLSLRWPDIQWDAGRIVVTSPKTAHHHGKGSRVIPLFPELRPLLQKVYDAADDKGGFVITRYRMANANLRTRLMKTVRRAGLEPWPKLFHNLRATRETELAADYPLHVVCKWIGNSIQVATRNYLQVRDEDFRRAANPAHYFAHMTATACVSQSMPGGDTASSEPEEKPKKRGETLPIRKRRVSPTGVEPVAFSLGRHIHGQAEQLGNPAFFQAVRKFRMFRESLQLIAILYRIPGYPHYYHQTSGTRILSQVFESG